MSQEHKDIEQLLRETFKGYQEPVFESDWEQLERALPREKHRHRFLWAFWLSLPVAAGIAFWLFQPNAIVQHSKSVEKTLSHAQGKEINPSDVNQMPADDGISYEKITPPSRNRSQATASGTSEKRLEKSAYRRTDAVQSRNGSKGESQNWSSAGNNSLGGSTGQINNELREFKGEIPNLSGRSFHQIVFNYSRSKAAKLVFGNYRPALDGWRHFRGPEVWMIAGVQFLSSAAMNVADKDEWKGKGLSRSRLQQGLIREIAAGISIPFGLSSLQVGLGESQTLKPMRQHWTVKTRMVIDSIPYRNMPGDTLFWIPVRFADTLVDVVTEFSEKRLIIPFRFTQNFPICAKFGLNFQVGGQLGILQSMKATIPSPYTDYTWSQVRSGMAGTAQTNAPVGLVDAKNHLRSRIDVQLGTGAYWRFNRNLTVKTNVMRTSGLNPLTRNGEKYHQWGGQLMFMYQW